MTPTQMCSGQVGLVCFIFGMRGPRQSREGSTLPQFIPGPALSFYMGMSRTKCSKGLHSLLEHSQSGTALPIMG